MGLVVDVFSADPQIDVSDCLFGSTVLSLQSVNLLLSTPLWEPMEKRLQLPVNIKTPWTLHT